MKINLNESVKVKLTDWGKEIFYHQYDRINKMVGKEVCKPIYPKEDENGYTEFQLWCFMQLYGEYMGMTLPNVVERFEIVYESEKGEKKSEDLISRSKLLSDLRDLVNSWSKYPVMEKQTEGVKAAIGYVELIPSANDGVAEKKKTFKPGDKFILEIGERHLDKFEIAGTDLYVRISRLEKLTPYVPRGEE